MSLDACADLVARGDPDRFRTVLAAPLAARKILLPIYAFNIEVSRAPWVTAEPMIAEMRLQWWRDALDEIANGAPVRRHEVASPLADVLDAEAAAELDGLIAARRHDIEVAPFEDADTLDTYLDRTAGSLMWVAARALGAQEPGPVRQFGRATGAAAYLRAVPALLEAGRRPLPEPMQDAARDLAQRGLAALRTARSQRRAVPRGAVPALWPGWQAKAVLRRAAGDPALVAADGIAPSEARRRGSLLLLSLTGRW